MEVKQWLDTVEEHMGRPARPYEQRFIARQYAAENTTETARGIADLILGNDATPARSVFTP